MNTRHIDTINDESHAPRPPHRSAPSPSRTFTQTDTDTDTHTHTHTHLAQRGLLVLDAGDREGGVHVLRELRLRLELWSWCCGGVRSRVTTVGGGGGGGGRNRTMVTTGIRMLE
jgi:hypothetical protein